MNDLIENATLKRELAARVIRTMGPRSPYWNCTMCGAAQQTPLGFQHKPECILADVPKPPALVVQRQHKHHYSIEVEHAEMIAALRDIEFIVDGKEDADNGTPNDAMKIMSVVQTILRKVDPDSYVAPRASPPDFWAPWRALADAPALPIRAHLKSDKLFLGSRYGSVGDAREIFQGDGFANQCVAVAINGEVAERLVNSANAAMTPQEGREP